MKNLTPKAILVPTGVLILICVIITGLLAGTNSLTKEPIAQQAKLKAKATREIVLPIAKSYKEMDITKLGSDLNITDCYAGYDDKGELVGYTLTSSKNGYSGAIVVMVGILASDNTVNGVSILSQTETPGLGANATKSDFTDQYKQAVPQKGFGVVKTADVKDGEIKAMTGATISSKAVTDAVNNSLEVYNNKIKDKELSKDIFIEE